MNIKTAEERAAERFPAFKVMDWTRRQDGYATCIREEVEPLESENFKLRALVQGILDLSFHDTECNSSVGLKCDCMKSVIDARAKEHGFVPTNTKDDNG